MRLPHTPPKQPNTNLPHAAPDLHESVSERVVVSQMIACVERHVAVVIVQAIGLQV